jgi:cytoskeletal protein CcmA (bactofilin family)
MDLLRVMAAPLLALYQVSPGHVDDGAAAVLAEVRHRLHGRQVDGLHVDLEAAVEGFLVHVHHGLVDVGEAGVVHQDVEAAETLHRGADHGFHVLATGDVGAHAVGLVANFLRHRLGALTVEVGEHHLCTLFGEQLRDTRTETGCRTCDHRYSVLESHCSLPTSVFVYP